MVWKSSRHTAHVTSSEDGLTLDDAAHLEGGNAELPSMRDFHLLSEAGVCRAANESLSV